MTDSSRKNLDEVLAGIKLPLVSLKARAALALQIGELQKELREADKSAALSFRESRACLKSAELHLEKCRELNAALEKLLDRRRASTRELGHGGMRKP